MQIHGLLMIRLPVTILTVDSYRDDWATWNFDDLPVFAPWNRAHDPYTVLYTRIEPWRGKRRI